MFDSLSCKGPLAGCGYRIPAFHKALAAIVLHRALEHVNNVGYVINESGVPLILLVPGQRRTGAAIGDVSAKLGPG